MRVASEAESCATSRRHHPGHFSTDRVHFFLPESPVAGTRSNGSITTAIGLMLASRRYIGYSVLEVAILHAPPKEKIAQILEDVFTTKLGLTFYALSRPMRIAGAGRADIESATRSP